MTNRATNMNRNTPIIIGLLLLLALSTGTAEGKTTIQNFQLYTACEPVALLVENLREKAAEIGLTKTSIETTVRSRLRAARIYNPEREIPFFLYVYVNINTVGPAYHIRVELQRYLVDLQHETMGIATTWNTGSTGTHGNNPGFILQGLSQHIDLFIDQYLEANEEDCKQ